MMMPRRGLLAGMAGAAALANMPAFAQGRTLVVNSYGGRWETFWRNQLLPKFTQQTGIQTRLDVGLGTGWLTAFRTAGKANPPFPMLMTNERYSVILRDEGYCEPIPVAKLKNYADLNDIAKFPNNAALTAMISPIGIAYRTDMVKVPPKGWKDLWNPRYKGQIGLYSITNSAAIMLLMMAGQLFGKGQGDVDTAVAKFAELKPFPQVAFSGQMTPLLQQGQVAIAPIDYSEVAGMKKRGVPVEIVLPEDGIMMFDQTFAIAAGAPAEQKDMAVQYLDFLLSPEIQLLMAREFAQAPVNNKVTLPPDIAADLPITPEALAKAVRFDWSLASTLVGEMGEKWSKAI
ncbi:ABC transporter substrate-binding protein [Acetobacteraceae bacterium H6797]|nr:ABC transporter substrate-binding protein [Acetobacteraceae bacterium H6797]